MNELLNHSNDEGGSPQSPLPDGWIEVPLSEVTVRPENINPKSKPKQEFGYVDISSIDNRTHRIVEPKRILGGDAPSRAKRPVRAGDVLFSNVRTYLKNVAIVPKDLDADVCSTGFTVLRSNGAVDPRYLFRYAMSQRFIDAVTPKQTGSNYPATNDTVVRSMMIPLAPLSEQRRIVERIDSLTNELSQARQRAHQVLALLRELRRSVLTKAFSGKLTEEYRPNGSGIDADAGDFPDDWGAARSRDLFSFVTSGSRGWAKYYAESGPAFIRVGNLDHDSIALDLTDLKRVQPPEGAERERTRIHEGDILVSVTADVGMVALVPNGFEEAYVNQHVAIARPNHAVNPRFLAWFLAAPRGGQEQFHALQRGATRQGLILDDLKALEIPFPEPAEQADVVDRIDYLLGLIDGVMHRVQRSLKLMQIAEPSVLESAFSGDLVIPEAELAMAEGRDYETAEQRLARLG